MRIENQDNQIQAPPQIEFHADDYGLFPAQSRRILACRREGCLNGISVLPNSPELAACMARLEPGDGTLAVTVHLNLTEGRCLSSPAEVPLLADGQGVLRGSFGKLLLQSYLPGRRELRRQLRLELSRQIAAVAAYLPRSAALRLDGHAHYHMLPVVFDALMDVITAEKLNVSYIRIPEERVGLYRKHLGQLADFAPVNLAKVAILNLLARRNRRKYGDYLKNLEQKLFLGVFLSGRMYRENVALVLPEAEAYARAQGIGIELLAHPGGVEEPEDLEKLTNRDDIAFFTSPNRAREGEMFRTIRPREAAPGDAERVPAELSGGNTYV